MKFGQFESVAKSPLASVLHTRLRYALGIPRKGIGEAADRGADVRIQRECGAGALEHGVSANREFKRRHVHPERFELPTY